MFKCAPEDPYTKWDKGWLDKARVILQARKNAEVARVLNSKPKEEQNLGD